MQASAIKSSTVVVRFSVALVIIDFMMQNPRRGVNAILKQEAAYFGGIVILPFMDLYELVVLKTIAICEYSDAWTPGVLDCHLLLQCYCSNNYSIWGDVLWPGMVGSAESDRIAYLVTRSYGGSTPVSALIHAATMVLKVFVPSYESNGRMWPHIHACIVAALLLFQVTMFGYFGVNKFYYTPIIIPLPICSLIFAFALEV